MIDSIIEKHYKSYLTAYYTENIEEAKLRQEIIKDLYGIKTGEHPDNPDSDYSKYCAFWGWLALVYGS